MINQHIDIFDISTELFLKRNFGIQQNQINTLQRWNQNTDYKSGHFVNDHVPLFV